MPPRYAYWTIIVDDQPTAFRAGALEDIMPTFNRLKEKHPSAKLMWFQQGKLWLSRIDAREAMQMRGERGRDRDPRQTRSFEGGKPVPGGRPFMGRRSEGHNRPEDRPEWKPKASSDRPAWKPKSSSGRPEWKPKRSPGERPLMGRQAEGHDRPEWKPKGSSSLKPQASSPQAEGKRKWIPKAEYQKSQGPPSRPEAASARSRRSSADSGRAEADTEAKRDDRWRPGGEHKDPRQKYKDAKKAKWGRFKQAIRARATKKRGGS
jgi:hypothetical protein